MREDFVHDKAFALVPGLGLAVLAPAAFAVTAFGTDIVNTATADFFIGATSVSIPASATTTVSGRTPATIEFLQYVPGTSGGEVEHTNQTQCNGSNEPAPVYIAPPGKITLPSPGDLRLNPTGYYSSGDPLFVRVTDYDQNKDANAPDTITVNVKAGTADSETLTLTETGNSTGVFVGYIQSTGAAATAGNCELSIEADKEIVATYTDSLDSVTTVTTAAMVDPYGAVFDADTGAAVDGASVSLIDNASGLPATVYCDDGVTVLAQPVTSGAPTACDATMVAGGYRFPRVAPGSYRLAVTPPAGYSFPSVKAGPLFSYTVVGTPGNGASYGSDFPLNPGPAVKIDLPLDPASGGLLITKTALKPEAAIGDFVPYSLGIRNASAAVAGAVQISDRLPPGFRYQAGSAHLNGAAIADPAISADGRSLTFTVGNIAGNTTVTLKYVAQVSPGARIGPAENTAAAVAPNSSNTARAMVLVRDDLFRERAILMGRVVLGSCDDKVENDDQGLANARVMLEDGSYVQTDQDGRWHLDNIRPGTHVVQLDLDSLPEGYEAVACENNDRFAGRAYSQFVNLRGGSLWRADFYVRKKAPEAICLDQKLSLQNGVLTLSQTYPVSVQNGSMTLALPAGARVSGVTLNGQPFEAEQSGSMVTARLPGRSARMTDTLKLTLEGAEGEIRSFARVQVDGLAAQSLPPLAAKAGAEAAQCAPIKTIDKTPEAPMAAPAQKELQLVEKLPYDEKWLAEAQPGVEWLHPQEGFSPALPAVKLAVKHLPDQKVSFTVNGKEVDILRYDGALYNGPRTVGYSLWRGVEIEAGDNRIEMTVTDKDGKLVRQETRNIHYAIAPAHVAFDAKQSRLVADGKTRPVIAVKFTDKQGFPVRKGVNGDFQINEPYQAWDKQEGIERAPLTGRIGNKPHFEITADGTALIELMPTTQSGEAVLGFQFGDGQAQEVRAWLKPGARDWVLVGFAEGTAAHKQLSGNQVALTEAGADDKLYDGNRAAFYAKGMIKGEYLLTLAYDSAKQKGDGGSKLSSLKQAIDPNQFYTLYADATSPQFDAASASKLYVRLERNQFYALFGDYDTGLTVTEFGRYSRSLNGVKSEYKGDKLSYNAFAAMTAQTSARDVIPGDGTSGPYRLSRGNIVVNSDKIRIETRDRFRSEVVLNTRQLTRYLDYDIDYTTGIVFFREPVAGRDENFNPNTIVAEYETDSAADKRLSYGGRVALKASDKLELGATHIREGGVASNGSLSAADATLKLGDKTKVVAEVATSDYNASGAKTDGTAWKVEVSHDDEKLSARAYAREQQGGFGLNLPAGGQQSGTENGTRKVGADLQLRLSETLQLQGQAYRQETTGTGAQRDVLESLLQWRKDALSTQAGVRLAHDEDGLGQVMDSRQIILGAGYELLNRKLTLRSAAELDFSGGSQSVDFPNRYKLGADYLLTEQTTLFAEQEFDRGDKISADISRVGLRTRPWSGGEMAASLGSDLNNDAGRLFSSLGLVQKWQINPAWQMDFGLDRVDTLKSAGVAPLNANVPLTSGTLNGDYTALFTGVNYTDKLWSANGRVEWRTGDTDDRINLLAAVQRNLDRGQSVAAGFSYTNDKLATGAVNRKLDSRLSWASRPNDSQWILLDRLDFIDELTEDPINGKLASTRLVDNFNANWMPNRRTQIALQYGAKYAFDTVDGAGYRGYTDLVGAEIRRDLNKDWDVGLHGSALHSWNGGQIDYGLGAALGYKLFENTWVAVGYNLLGFNDADFAGAEYRAKGFYAALRMKFDQDTLGLNKPGSIFTMKP